MNEQLYKLAPQMRDYDHPKVAKPIWIPYVMYRCGIPGATTESCTFDKLGFRNSTSNDGRIVNSEMLHNGDLLDREVDLFIGGSTAFGVGSTSDEYTIPSYINKMSDACNINLGGRSWTLQQNLINFVFHRNTLPTKQPFKRMILFAGYNEINCMYMSQFNVRPYGNIYGWNHYFSRMNQEFYDKTSNELIFPDNVENMICSVKPEENGADYLKKDLDAVFTNWKSIADSLNIKVYFILQPVLEWLDKELSWQEIILLKERRGIYPQEPEQFSKEKNSYFTWYAKYLCDLCGKYGFHFTDLNRSISQKNLNSEWLFIDPWHLNDKGNEIVANEIIKCIYR